MQRVPADSWHPVFPTNLTGSQPSFTIFTDSRIRGTSGFHGVPDSTPLHPGVLADPTNSIALADPTDPVTSTRSCVVSGENTVKWTGMRGVPGDDFSKRVGSEENFGEDVFNRTVTI